MAIRFHLSHTDLMDGMLDLDGVVELARTVAGKRPGVAYRAAAESVREKKSAHHRSRRSHRMFPCADFRSRAGSPLALPDVVARNDMAGRERALHMAQRMVVRQG